jgi:PAS domain S-box-containing protein
VIPVNSDDTLFTHNPIGITVVRADATIAQANPALAQLLELSPEDLVGLSLGQIIHPEDWQGGAVWEAQKQSNPSNWETRCLTPNGRICHVLCKIAALPNRHPPEYIITVTDISAQKKTEADLHIEQATLLRLVTELEYYARNLGLMEQIRNVLLTEIDLATLLRSIVESTATVAGFDMVSLYLIEGDFLILQHQVGYETFVSTLPIYNTRGVMARTVRTGKPLLLAGNATDDPDFIAVEPGIHSEICVPLYDSGSVAGAFNIESKSELTFTESDFELVQGMAQHISIALERARLYVTLRASKEQYQAVVDNVREIIFQMDTDGRWTFLNPAWTTLTGYTIRESLGVHIQEFVVQDNAAADLAQVLSMLEYSAPERHYEIRLTHKQGNPIPVEIYIQRQVNLQGEWIGSTGTLTDMSARIQNEQRKLEVLLQGRLIDMHRGFLSALSHDLRTPLSVMNTSLYLLRRKLTGEVTLLKYVSTVTEQVSQLVQAVEDMVEMSHFDDNTYTFDFYQINLNSIVRDVLTSLAPLIEAQNHEVIFQPDESVQSIALDAKMIGRAIRHLVENAIRYTAADGRILIQTKRYTSEIHLIVQDNGIGIADEELSRIFERFYKVDKARSTHSGRTGLGLALTRRIIEAHRGRIEVQSVVGTGSTFTLVIPY